MTANRRVGFEAFVRASRAALQWRLLLLWIVALQIPTALVALPVWSRLGGLLDHSVHSAEWARHFDALAMSDVYGLTRGFASVSVIAMIATLLLSPLLTGMAVTAAQSVRNPSFRELLHGGAHSYWPMLRLSLWALLPFGAAAIAGAIGILVAFGFALRSVLQSQADAAIRTATIALIALLLLVHATVESGRAQFAADPALRCAWRALWRGIVTILRRPLATFGLYVGTSTVGYALVLALGMLRVRTTAVGFSGFIAAMALTQLITAALAWQRTARLFALTGVARSAQSSFGPAPAIPPPLPATVRETIVYPSDAKSLPASADRARSA